MALSAYTLTITVTKSERQRVVEGYRWSCQRRQLRSTATNQPKFECVGGSNSKLPSFLPPSLTAAAAEEELILAGQSPFEIFVAADEPVASTLELILSTTTTKSD
jgi:hypothetical protein